MFSNKKIQSGKHHWQGVLAVKAIQLAGWLPRWLGYQLADLLALILWLIPGSDSRAVIMANLNLCFPQINEKERLHLGRNALREVFRGGMDMAYCWRRPEQALSQISKISGSPQALQACTDNKQPVVLLAPHLGCWEVTNLWLGHHYDFHALFKPSETQALNQLIWNSRQSLGSQLYPTTPRGIAGLVRALKRGGVTAILPDQVPDKRMGGQHAPFFGHPALTASLAIKLIKQSNATAFVIFALRNKDGTFELNIRKPDERLYDRDLQIALIGLNASIEAAIREAPEQYVWNYKRFRRLPEEIPKVYADSRRRKRRLKKKIKMEKH